MGKMENDDESKDANEIYDERTKVIDMTKKRATEMRSNQRVRLAEQNCDDEKEIKRENLKVEIINVYGSYIDKYCNANGEIKIKCSGTKINPVNVLNGIKDKVIDQQYVVVPTDKTNRLSFIPSETYKESMKEHHIMDKVINKKELNKIENDLCGHSKSVTKIFQVALKHGQQKRALANATVHKNGQVPVLKGAEKDHKENEKSIKMRPIVNAMDGPKKNISDLFSDIVTPVIASKKNDIICYSTEELLESFEKYNKTINNQNEESPSEYIIGSMDATSLYPS